LNSQKITISSGTLEALKWLGMLTMTIDHVNRIFYQGQYYWALCVGRVAMPLFAFVFSYNFAQAKEFREQNYEKSFKRLILFGILATPGYILMRHLPGIIPLNILFLLFAVAAFLFFYEQKGKLNLESLAIFFVGGVFVEFSWPGILVGIAFWFYCKQTYWLTSLMAVMATATLYLDNLNNWALAALPIIWLAPYIRINIPRIRYLFWCYYPLHLTVFVTLRYVIS
jgi:hypothetical protein